MVCKKFNNKLIITDLLNIAYEYLGNLNQKIIERYPHVMKLDANYNPRIEDVTHMMNLKILYASGDCGIDQNGIKGLNLEKLNAENNEKIEDVSHMKNLKILCASGCCGIDQNGIKGLNLEELYAHGNLKITQPNKH